MPTPSPGYLTTSDGRKLAFSTLVNNHTMDAHGGSLAINRIVEVITELGGNNSASCMAEYWHGIIAPLVLLLFFGHLL